jgi:hypothetical protein
MTSLRLAELQSGVRAALRLLVEPVMTTLTKSTLAAAFILPGLLAGPSAAVLRPSELAAKLSCLNEARRELYSSQAYVAVATESRYDKSDRRDSNIEQTDEIDKQLIVYTREGVFQLPMKLRRQIIQEPGQQTWVAREKFISGRTPYFVTMFQKESPAPAETFVSVRVFLRAGDSLGDGHSLADSEFNEVQPIAFASKSHEEIQAQQKLDRTIAESLEPIIRSTEFDLLQKTLYSNEPLNIYGDGWQSDLRSDAKIENAIVHSCSHLHWIDRHVPKQLNRLHKQWLALKQLGLVSDR